MSDLCDSGSAAWMMSGYYYRAVLPDTADYRSFLARPDSMKFGYVAWASTPSAFPDWDSSHVPAGPGKYLYMQFRWVSDTVPTMTSDLSCIHNYAGSYNPPPGSTNIDVQASVPQPTKPPPAPSCSSPFVMDSSGACVCPEGTVDDGAGGCIAPAPAESPPATSEPRAPSRRSGWKVALGFAVIAGLGFAGYRYATRPAASER